MKTCPRLPIAALTVRLLAGLTQPTGLFAADFHDPNADRDALPTVPSGFAVSFFAREPLVRQPCSMAFDAQGRLCVGMGPQYRNPKPDTPGDSVVFVLDDDGDGRADRTKVFASGFNAIQGLAWHGRDLWVANAPDLTVVRDLDGDDEADEYVRVYTDLGNLEHGLHGLNWAPDGKLYLSKGNSKGLTQPGRVAPKPFRELWGVTAPAGSPDLPPRRAFKKGGYRKAYHDPNDDWGREGGILRCDDGGGNLEIVSRGFRNPWDISFDTGFNWIGTDNDQTTGDRVFMPFFGAHFGWNHPWSAHWGMETHAPSAPVSGPLFEGSGTGVVFGNSPAFPASHRGVFFINDWLRKITFVWRPRWDGALLRPAGEWEPFVQGGPALFRPTDLEFGPDGALWILGWGSGYGAEYKDGQMTSEGRVFRVVSTALPPARGKAPKRAKPLAQWTVTELVEDFDGPLPVWRIDAQDELVRRGDKVKNELLAALGTRPLPEARETWTAWTLGRLLPRDRDIDDWFSAQAADATATLNLRVQALRILALRIRQAGGDHALPDSVAGNLRNPEARLRFEAVQAIGQAQQHAGTPALLELLAAEQDPATFYAAWQTLRRLQEASALKRHLADARAGVRKAALLALLEDHALKEAEVRPLVSDPDAGVRDIASLWQRKAAGGGESVVVRGRPLNAAPAQGEPEAPPVGLAGNIKARSGARYALAPAGLRPGARPYTDRSYDLRQIPATLVGLDFIQTANNDDGSRGESWLSFEALMPVRVHVAFDARAAALPSWLRDHYQRSTNSIRADHWTFHLYTRDFPAGRVELGGNTDDARAGGKGNYIVVLEPLPLPLPATPTALEPALARVSEGDRARGSWLFHARGGAGCFQCHRLDEHGNSFGPDLGTVGDRATARHIVQSMLEPNAVITEGFHLQTVETAEADYSGILIEESGLSLTLGLATGQRQVIPKAGIKARKAAASSAMPAYDTVLAPQAAADLAAYLLAQKAGAPKPARPAASAAPAAPGESRPPETAAPTPIVWPAGDGFRFTEQPDRLVLAYSGQPVAEYVFSDPRILRPHFRSVHAPGGIQVTRTHPPVPGIDATDHDTMHPGLWLAFGDINGHDFWRNKGRIEHVRFTEPPRAGDGRLTFATENRLQSANGQTLGTQLSHVTLRALRDGYLLTWQAEFVPAAQELVFGDQEEMGLGVRVATGITEKKGGVLLASNGARTAKATWGKAFDWCDYSGALADRTIGVTLMPDPANFRPSWFHNRDYGLMVANPFGRKSMNQGDPSRVVVQPGERLRLRFGVYLHATPSAAKADIDGAYREFLNR